MPRFLVLLCPLTGLRHDTSVTPDPDEPVEVDGAPTFELPEEDEEMLPIGWGQVRVRRAVPNPVIAEQEKAVAAYVEQRIDEALLEGMAAIRLNTLNAMVASATTDEEREKAQRLMDQATPEEYAADLFRAWRDGLADPAVAIAPDLAAKLAELREAAAADVAQAAAAEAVEALDLPEVEQDAGWETSEWRVLAPDAVDAAIGGLEVVGFGEASPAKALEALAATLRGHGWTCTPPTGA